MKHTREYKWDEKDDEKGNKKKSRWVRKKQGATDSEKNINHCKEYQGWGKKGWWTTNGRFEFKVERRLA